MFNHHAKPHENAADTISLNPLFKRIIYNVSQNQNFKLYSYDVILQFTYNLYKELKMPKKG